MHVFVSVCCERTCVCVCVSGLPRLQTSTQRVACIQTTYARFLAEIFCTTEEEQRERERNETEVKKQ